MKCLHCSIAFHPSPTLTDLGSDIDGYWVAITYVCPTCQKCNIFLADGREIPAKAQGSNEYEVPPYVLMPIWPKGNIRPCPLEVPDFLRKDFEEACITLPVSAKASAALSRRCLQNLLRDAAKVKPGNLVDEIQEVIDKGNLPSHFTEIIDAVRHIGNFAAHPIKSKNTGEIIDVEPEEAEWNLDVLEAFFDFYYVQPALVAKKKDTLNAKLKDAGKHPMK